MKVRKILIDDDEAYLRAAKRLYNLDACFSGWTPDVAKAIDDHPSIVLVDLDMGMMPGTSIASELLHTTRNIEVIIVSAFVSEEIKHFADQIGFVICEKTSIDRLLALIEIASDRLIARDTDGSSL